MKITLLVVAMWQHIHQLTGCSFWHKEFMLLDRVSGSDSFQVRAGPRRCSNSSSTTSGTHLVINIYWLLLASIVKFKYRFKKSCKGLLLQFKFLFVQHGILTTIYMCIIWFIRQIGHAAGVYLLKLFKNQHHEYKMM